MITRKATCLDGKTREFSVDNDYATIDNPAHVMGWLHENKKLVAVVAYTKIKNDCGEKYEERFGCPTKVYYDNGLIGYQCLDGFVSMDEAKESYKARKMMSTKAGVVAYCDVMLFDRNGIVKC